MWIKNSDDGRWYDKNPDTLPKDIFNSLEQAVNSVTLYSKALSGSTYVATNSLDSIYDVLVDSNSYNWYISSHGSTYSIGPTPSSFYKSIDGTSSQEYYDKYTYEYGLTLKNKFTPVKLINDSIDNYLEVDVSTTNLIPNIGSYSPGMIIDGIILKPGHRVLIKDQISYISLSSDIDPNTYFIGNYTVVSNNITSITYSYYNDQNGIYGYTNSTLVRTGDLLTYSDSYRYSVIVKLGSINKLNQYHLTRLRNGYFPLYINGDPMYFQQKKNWMLKNRVDYHNIYEISYYDIKKFSTQSYIENVGTQSYTYTIPSRILSIGDFGMISVYQNGVSNIIDNKYKVTLQSISETSKYYWICGYSGTLLRILKLDFSIIQSNINEFNNFTSVDFFDDLRGLVVGKYNTIYFTNDGGNIWNSISSPEFDEYSYNKVIYNTSFDKAYIGGESGVFIEMTYLFNYWSMYKRAIIKYLDINEPTEEYLLADDINDMVSFSFTYSNPWNLSYPIGSTYSGTILSEKDILLMCTNGGNILMYNINNFISDYDFLYLSFSQSTTNDIQSIDIVSGSSSIYIASDSIYSININEFSVYNPTTNNISSTYSSNLVYDVYANKIRDYNGINLYLSGNNSTLYYSGYTSSLNDLDSNFNYRYNSKLMFLDYEIGSKLNFIDITTQDYKLPLSLTFSESDLSLFINVNNISNENNWLNYYKDKEKTFQYYTSFDISNEVLFSTTFSYFTGSSYFTFSSSDINTTYNAILNLAPTINIPSKSRYMSGTYSITGSTYSEAIFLYKYLIIFKKDSSYVCDIGDVLYLSSDIISTTFILNQKVSLGGYVYLYCYTDFDQTIINDIKNYQGVISLNNLNKYSLVGTTGSNSFLSGIDIISSLNYIDYDPINYFPYSFIQSNLENSDLMVNFNLHPVSYGYSLSYQNGSYTLSSKFNNKTAYYNMQSLISTNTITATMSYDIPFLKFGYKPTYNIYDYLNNINSNIFNSSKNFLSMPKYTSLPGNNANSFTSSNIYIDTNFDTNKLLFGSNFEFEWNSIWINTFVDVTLHSGGLSFSTTDILVTNKYFDISSGGYVIEFHKKLSYIYSDPIDTIDIISRNSLQQISNDLQVLNNIQRSQTTKSLELNTSFINLENQLNFKFPTDSYCKILLSDKDIKDNLTGIVYTDDKNELALNIIKLGQQINIPILSTGRYSIGSTGGNGTYSLYVVEENGYIGTPDHPSLLILDNLNNILLNYDLQNDASSGPSDVSADKAPFSVALQGLYTGSVNYMILRINGVEHVNFLSESFSYSTPHIIYSGFNSNVKLEVYQNNEVPDYVPLPDISGGGSTSSSDYLLITYDGSYNLDVGDGIILTFDGGTFSSNYDNQNFFGYQTITGIIGSQSFYTDTQWQSFNIDISPNDPGNILFIDKDPFLNYEPVDIIEIGVDKQPKASVEINPNNIVLTGLTYSLVNIDFTKYRFLLVDGLSISSLYSLYPWVLEADISDAIIGQDQNGLIWYCGIWNDGIWSGGTWNSGKWVSGDWYGGTWNSFGVKYKLLTVEINKNSNSNFSKWYNGRWFDGIWNNGTWYNGRRYGGTWSNGSWFNGTWNDGSWINGLWNGGIWVIGTWYNGIFNCDNKPSYWINGSWKGGDFENGLWYNGQFTEENGNLSRFGTGAFNTRTATWNSGKFLGGEFHSYLNTDNNGNTIASEFNKYSAWYTGEFSGGSFYGGAAYAINFSSGVWFGGVIEEIQIIGIQIIPGKLTQFILNGNFPFNINDKIWVVNDNNPTPYASIGTNLNPGNYTVLMVNQNTDISTTITISVDISNITGGTVSVNNIDTGLRLTANFQDSIWKQGIFTNGIFGGNSIFEGGIWYGGIFQSQWGY